LALERVSCWLLADNSVDAKEDGLMFWFRRGRRLLTAGSIGLVLVAAMHTMAHFSPLPDDPALKAVMTSMSETKIEMGFPVAPSIGEVLAAESLSMAFLMVTLALVTFAVAGCPEADPRLLRTLAALNTVCMAALAVVHYMHSYPPPVILFGAVGLLFLGATVLPPPHDPAAAGKMSVR
jgi:hypothetical protein